MSKHQTCKTCHCDFVGPDSDIGENNCPDCDEVLHAECNDECNEEIARLQLLLNAEIESHQRTMARELKYAQRCANAVCLGCGSPIDHHYCEKCRKLWES